MVQSTNLYLAPAPRRLTARDGVFCTHGRRYIKLISDDMQSLMPAVEKTGLEWEITASPKTPKSLIGLTIRVDKTIVSPDQSYKLIVRPDSMEITATTPEGAFYGACTLAQILMQTGCEIPCLSIYDWPDFPARGVMLDISRDKVPTMEALYHLVDLLSSWKINQIQLYTEHTFAYQAHPTAWAGVDPMTGEQILALDAYCKSQFVELVPNQNSFGHLEKWFKHDEYRSMAEAPDGCNTIWGWKDAFSLCPGDKRSIPFIKGLYEELLPHFSSLMFNVGLDETVDLGEGKSKQICGEKGTGRVYLDFLLQIYPLVKAQGRTMMFWGDIIVKHPELIPELPNDVIALEWGYEFDSPFKEDCAKFHEAGIPFYVCPGTSSWNSIAGRTENAIENIASAARNGLEQGAIGLLNTDWGDRGHWQPLAVSYLGYMAGAMSSWNAKTDVKKNLAMNLSLHAFGDPTGTAGRAFYDLGNLYRAFAKRYHNTTAQFQMLFNNLDNPAVVEGIDMSEFDEFDVRLEATADDVRGVEMSACDGEISSEELDYTIEMLELASEVGRMRLGGPKPADFACKVEAVKRRHAHVWMLRNRVSELSLSLGELKV